LVHGKEAHPRAARKPTSEKLSPRYGSGVEMAIVRVPIANRQSLSESKTRKNKPMEAAERGNENGGDLRVKLESAVEKAKVLCERLQEQTSAAAKAADRTVRENPYQAVGVAFGLGILAGILISRGRRD
jgi:ElaB/YqjD/DUF883 family membrane-anchored ribosome-binding protein